jgi:hypothetical protein
VPNLASHAERPALLLLVAPLLETAAGSVSRSFSAQQVCNTVWSQAKLLGEAGGGEAAAARVQNLAPLQRRAAECVGEMTAQNVSNLTCGLARLSVCLSNSLYSPTRVLGVYLSLTRVEPLPSGTTTVVPE